mgnify:CR=1 FL=1
MEKEPITVSGLKNLKSELEELKNISNSHYSLNIANSIDNKILLTIYPPSYFDPTLIKSLFLKYKGFNFFGSI